MRIEELLALFKEGKIGTEEVKEKIAASQTQQMKAA